MYRFAVAVFACGSFAVIGLAQDTKPDAKWEPPPTPEGWKAVVSKDSTYRFAVPKGTTRNGTRERNVTINGIRLRSLINYSLLKDGTMLEVESAILSGSSLAGVKAAEVIDAIVDGQRDDGFKVSDPKDVTVGAIKAKEYRLTKDKTNQRMVVFFRETEVFCIGRGRGRSRQAGYGNGGHLREVAGPGAAGGRQSGGQGEGGEG